MNGNDSFDYERRSASFVPGDCLNFDGSYEWVGCVVMRRGPYAGLMSVDGRLCRVTVEAPDLEARIANEQIRLLDTSETLVVRAAVCCHLALPTMPEAVRTAMAAPSDPADFDRWMLPLPLLASGTALRPVAAQYLAMPAHERRQFEAVIDLIEGERQREVFIEHVLGPVSVQELRQRYGLQKSAVRMARWRATNFVRSYMGHALAV